MRKNAVAGVRQNRPLAFDTARRQIVMPIFNPLALKRRRSLNSALRDPVKRDSACFVSLAPFETSAPSFHDFSIP